MIAAAYLRKSTTQDVADEDRSVAFQLDHARAFAKSKGWAVPDEYVFVDDGVSGAEFTRRPGLVRLLASLKPRAPFEALVVYDESRLGREQIETAYVIKQIVSAGVQVWTSKDARRRTLDSPTDKILLNLVNYANEMQRHAATERTRDGHVRKVRAGHAVGGRVFGYTNVRVEGHVERRVVEAEAAVVRDIFLLAAKGWGYRSIAHELNDRGAPAPKPRQGRPVGWSSSTIRDVLHRDLYRGVVIYGKKRKRDEWGQKRPTLRPQDDWITVPAEHLRVINDAEWTAARERISKSKQSYLRDTRRGVSTVVPRTAR
jgi:site-specific DNA recombinase